MNDMTFEEALLGDLDFEYVPPCESDWCQEKWHKGVHDADWYVRMDMCGHGGAWCNQRFVRYQQMIMYGTLLECNVCGMLGQRIDYWKSVRGA